MVLIASFKVSTISDIQHKEFIATLYFKWSPKFTISSINNLRFIPGENNNSKLCLFMHLKFVIVLKRTFQEDDLKLTEAAFISLKGFYNGGN